MALQTVPPTPFGRFIETLSGGPSVVAARTMDAAGEWSGYIYKASEAMAISHVGFLPQASTGGVAEIRIETVSAADGKPTGTLWATNTNGTSGTLVAGTFELVALGATANIAAGDVFAVLVKFSAGTSFTTAVFTGATYSLGTPYETFNAGSSSIGDMRLLSIAVGSSSSAFYKVYGTLPFISYTANTFNNTDNARQGLRFKVAMKGRLWGLRHFSAGQTSDYDYRLYSDAGTLLASGSHDKDQAQPGTNLFRRHPFASPPTLDPDTWYRLVIVPTSATNAAAPYFTLPSADYRSACPLGVNGHLTTFTDSGGWIDTNTDKVPLMDLLFDQFDDGAGGGGGIKGVDMRGGFL